MAAKEDCKKMMTDAIVKGVPDQLPWQGKLAGLYDLLGARQSLVAANELNSIDEQKDDIIKEWISKNTTIDQETNKKLMDAQTSGFLEVNKVALDDTQNNGDIFKKTVTQEMFQPPTSEQRPTNQCDDDVDDTINFTKNPTVQDDETETKEKERGFQRNKKELTEAEDSEDVKRNWRRMLPNHSYDKVKKTVAKANDSSKTRLFHNVIDTIMRDHGGRDSGTLVAPLLVEMNSLARNQRSCLLRVHNNTPYFISASCITIFGGYDTRSVNAIQPNGYQPYYYKKSNLSLKGCAGIQIFAVKVSETSKLCFLVAFRNYTIQIRKRSQNKVAVLRINDSEAKPDLRCFDEIMKNENSNPQLRSLGCYKSDKPIFRSAYAGLQMPSQLQLDHITIDFSITPSFASHVEIKISTKIAIDTS